MCLCLHLTLLASTLTRLPSLWRVQLYLAWTAGVELANKDGMFGKSDPYLKFLALRKVIDTSNLTLKPRLRLKHLSPKP